LRAAIEGDQPKAGAKVQGLDNAGHGYDLAIIVGHAVNSRADSIDVLDIFRKCKIHVHLRYIYLEPQGATNRRISYIWEIWK